MVERATELPTDLPFQDSAETASTRRIVLGEIQRIQSLFVASLGPGAERTFDWWGTAHRVDPERWLALRASDVEATDDLEDLLSLYGGEGRSLEVIDVIDVFSWLVSDTLAKHSWLPSATQTLNLFMVQPLVNAACAPLAWVALSAALDDPDAPDDLMAIMRPMVFDMSTYPASRSAAASVRSAQADLVRARSPDLLPADWAGLDDAAWTEVCKQLVAEHRYQIETNVFQLITERAAAIRAGLRPR